MRSVTKPKETTPTSHTQNTSLMLAESVFAEGSLSWIVIILLSASQPQMHVLAAATHRATDFSTAVGFLPGCLALARVPFA